MVVLQRAVGTVLGVYGRRRREVRSRECVEVDLPFKLAPHVNGRFRFLGGPRLQVGPAA